MAHFKKHSALYDVTLKMPPLSSWLTMCTLYQPLRLPKQLLHFFKIWAKPGHFFVYFHLCLNSMTNLEGTIEYKRIRTLDRRMEGADESTELWAVPQATLLRFTVLSFSNAPFHSISLFFARDSSLSFSRFGFGDGDSVTRLGNLLDYGQLFKALCNN